MSASHASNVQLVILLLAAVVLLVGVARRTPLPQPVVLVLGGLGLGFIPGLPEVTLSPEIVFYVFLPPLVYSAAFLTSPESIAGNMRSIALLAIGLVVLTMAAVAVAAHLALPLPWRPAFVLGAVLGPTDPVAATALLRRLGAPQRIASILQGESLINDGTGLAVLKVALTAAAAGTFSLPSAVGDFVEISVLGLAIGVAVAVVATHVRSRLDEPQLEITTSVVAAYAAYAIADGLGFSGVLAAVGAGLYTRRTSTRSFGAASRMEGLSFWGVATFMLESLLFLLVGLSFPGLLNAQEGTGAGQILLDVAAVAGAVVLTRLAWMFTVPVLTGVLDRRRGRPPLTVGERAVLGWAGMRGGVSLAAALSIPAVIGGQPFPDRSLVILLAYTTVLATLVVPATTLPALVRRLGLAQPERSRRQAVEARIRVAEAALARIDELAGDGGGASPQALERAREHYELRLQRLSRELEGEETEAQQNDGTGYRDVRRELVKAERDTVEQMRRRRALPQQALIELERDLDLDESQLHR